MKTWRTTLLERPASKSLFLAGVVLLGTGGKGCYYEDKEPDPGTINYQASALPQTVDLSPASPTALITLSGDCTPKPRGDCSDPSGWGIGVNTLDGSYATIVVPSGGGGFQTATINIFNWDAVAENSSSVDGVITKQISFEPISPPYRVTGNRTVTVRLHPPELGDERAEEPVKKPRLTAIPPPSPLTPERDYSAAVAYTGPDTLVDITESGDTIYINTSVANGRPLTGFPLEDGGLVPLHINVSGGVSGKTYRTTVTVTTRTSPSVSASMVLTAEYR